MLKKAQLDSMKSVLHEIYGNRFKGMVLYGSEARGDASEQSDVDLLVLLEGPLNFGRDLETIINALYPIQLEIERPFHIRPVNFAVYQQGQYALYRHARAEGVLV